MAIVFLLPIYTYYSPIKNRKKDRLTKKLLTVKRCYGILVKTKPLGG